MCFYIYRIEPVSFCSEGLNNFNTSNYGLLIFLSAALGEFMHPCEDDIVCKCTTEENKVPYFNAPVYLENKEQIGKVDEIFGQLRDFVSFLLSFISCLETRRVNFWQLKASVGVYNIRNALTYPCSIFQSNFPKI